MNLSEFKDCQKHNKALLFKITSRCNDFCKFCIEYEFIKSKRADLSFQEIKDNYLYFKNKFKKIDYVILTGGEPTLHPQFFDIISFLKEEKIAFRVITNLLKFNEKRFLEKFKLFFNNFKNKEQEKMTKVVVSINDLPNRSLNARKKMSGLKKALILKLPLIVTVVVYKDNLNDLPKLSILIKKLFEKFAPGGVLNIEFRLIYVEGTLDFLLKQSLPVDLNKIKNSIEKTIDILNSPKVQLTLWNFPLCYLDNPLKVKNTGIEGKLDRRFIKINKDLQMKNAAVRNWEDLFKPYGECKKCRYKKICSGIDKKYFENYSFSSICAK
jgi:MoaA/NifB/PqqE/SkfB family radical SAM enzyme